MFFLTGICVYKKNSGCSVKNITRNENPGMISSVVQYYFYLELIVKNLLIKKIYVTNKDHPGISFWLSAIRKREAGIKVKNGRTHMYGNKPGQIGSFFLKNIKICLRYGCENIRLIT